LTLLPVNRIDDSGPDRNALLTDWEEWCCNNVKYAKTNVYFEHSSIKKEHKSPLKEVLEINIVSLFPV